MPRAASGASQFDVVRDARVKPSDAPSSHEAKGLRVRGLIAYVRRASSQCILPARGGEGRRKALEGRKSFENSGALGGA
jgi:hypothetical protein